MTSNTPRQAKDRILETAHDLFYRHGIRATGIDRVIAASGVTKVTFYRHFPSKHDLIRAYLAYRHQRWLSWFKLALARHGQDIHALVPALAEWLHSDEYRGCAFINAVAELADDLPEIVDIARGHKDDMMRVIAGLLPKTGKRTALAKAIAAAVDGAIVRAQYDASARPALQALDHIIAALVRPAET